MDSQHSQINRFFTRSFPTAIRMAMVVFLAMTFKSLPAQQPAATQKEPAKANFFEIQKEFTAYWKDRPVGKGSGYKPFKRWEWYWEQRVDHNGNFPSNDVVVREWDKYAETTAAKQPLDSVANWTPMGPFTTKSGYAGLGRVNCIAFHPQNKDIFWVGTSSGGIWKTMDFGKHWSTNYDQQPVLGVSDIVIDPKNPLIMYAATGDGDGGGSVNSINGSGAGDNKSIGVLKSVDGGDSWNATGLSWVADSVGLISRLVMDPVNSDVLYAATSKGIYKTDNGGARWELQQAGYFRDIVFNPGNNKLLYASTSVTSKKWSQIYRTEQGGNPWQLVKTFSGVKRIKLAVSPQYPGLVEALFTNSTNGLEGIYRSDDNGKNFNKFYEVLPSCIDNMLNARPDPSYAIYKEDPCAGQGWFDLCYLINPTKPTERWLGGVNTFKSEDSGDWWEMVTYWSSGAGPWPVVHADKHWFAFHPLQPNIFFEGNDGGIYYTEDGGKNWKDISEGLQIGQIYRIGNSYTNPEMVIAGFQDNGSQIDSAGTWLTPNIIGGDGMECIIDYTDPSIKYASYSYGVIKRTGDPTWFYKNVDVISKKIPGNPSGAWVTPYLIHPKDPMILYAGYTEIFKTTDRGDVWVQGKDLPAPNPARDDLIRSLEISQSNPDVMYAARMYSLFRTEDGWKNYTPVDNPTGADSCFITMIAVHPKDPNTLWVSVSGYKAGKKVYRSTDGGKNWTNMSESLPNLPVNCIVYQNDANDALYVGTDVGVFYRNAGMSQWRRYNQGLPNVVVTEMEIQYMAGKIRAATFGRGLWEADLYVEPGNFLVNGVSLPKNGGDISGGGIYKPGDKVTMKATPKEKWIFEGWFEKGSKISDSTEFSFNVNTNRNLVGQFKNPTGIEDKLKGQIHLYPNPTKGLVEIRLDKGLGKDLQKITATNMLGKTVYESSVKHDEDQFSIDLSANSQGNYVITLYFKSGEKVSYKVMLSK